MVKIVKLASLHAADAARLHIAGQPGTFLTRLGLDVLTVFYRALPESPVGFGYCAVDGTRMLGFVSATTRVGSLFWHLGTRHFMHFLPPLVRAYLRQPRLLWHSVATLFYPMLVQKGEDAEGPTQERAELLSIMIEPTARSQGIGAALLAALLAECAARQISAISVTVDAANSGARRFYAREHFTLVRQFPLMGRPMCLYHRAIEAPHEATLL